MLALLTSKSEAFSHNNGGGYFSAARRRDLLVDLREGFFRLCALACAGLFVYRGVYQVVEDPTRLNAALVAISEILTFTWLLLSRRPVTRDWNPLTVIVSVTASFGVALISLEPGVALVPVYIAAPLQLAALSFVIWGKISLGRSFAILPANRGVIKRDGMYRFVRHPIYAGYLCTATSRYPAGRASSFHNLDGLCGHHLICPDSYRIDARGSPACRQRSGVSRLTWQHMRYRLFYRIF